MAFSNKKSFLFSPMVSEFSPFMNLEKMMGDNLFKKMDESVTSIAADDKTSKSNFTSTRKASLWNLMKSTTRKSSTSIIDESISSFSPDAKENKLSLRQLDRFTSDQLLNVNSFFCYF